jgi:hypothetical protein
MELVSRPSNSKERARARALYQERIDAAKAIEARASMLIRDYGADDPHAVLLLREALRLRNGGL